MNVDIKCPTCGRKQTPLPDRQRKLLLKLPEKWDTFSANKAMKVAGYTEPSNALRALRALEKRGLVEVQSRQGDQICNQYQLTLEGRRIKKAFLS